MKPGTYFVGDPCYVIRHDVPSDDESWQDYCGSNEIGNCGEFTSDEISFSSAHTAFGDGEYYDQEGFGYGVDAGLLGLASVDHLSKYEVDGLKRLGKVISFKDEVFVRSDDGIVLIGNDQVGWIRIDTDPEIEEDISWDDCYDDEEDDNIID